MSSKRNKYVQYELPFPIDWEQPSPLVLIDQEAHRTGLPKASLDDSRPSGHEDTRSSRTNSLDILVLIDTNQQNSMPGVSGENSKTSEAE